MINENQVLHQTLVYLSLKRFLPQPLSSVTAVGLAVRPQTSAVTRAGRCLLIG